MLDQSHWAVKVRLPYMLYVPMATWMLYSIWSMTGNISSIYDPTLELLGQHHWKWHGVTNTGRY